MQRLVILHKQTQLSYTAHQFFCQKVVGCLELNHWIESKQEMDELFFFFRQRRTKVNLLFLQQKLMEKCHLCLLLSFVW